MMPVDIKTREQNPALRLTLEGNWDKPRHLTCPICSQPAASGRTTYRKVHRDLVARAGKLERLWTHIFVLDQFCSVDECAVEHGNFHHLFVWIASRYVSREEEQQIENAFASSDATPRICVPGHVDTAWEGNLPSSWMVQLAGTAAGTVLEHTISFRWPENGNGRVEELVMYLWDALTLLAKRHQADVLHFVVPVATSGTLSARWGGE